MGLNQGKDINKDLLDELKMNGEYEYLKIMSVNKFGQYLSKTQTQSAC